MGVGVCTVCEIVFARIEQTSIMYTVIQSCRRVCTSGKKCVFSVPAKMSILGIGQERKCFVRPLNQPLQNGSVLARSILQTYTP